MSTPPALFDRTALAVRRARAKREAFFLHEEAAIELEERLKDVNRAFTDVAVVTGFPEFWAQRFPGATVVADDDTLDLPVQSFDLVLHAMCLHQSNDPVGQLVQCQRALRPDGLLLAALFGGRTLIELREALTAAEAQVLGGLSPRVSPMIDIRDAGALLQRAGFALPVADADPRHVSYGSALALMQDLRAMGEANILAGRLRCPSPKALFAQMAANYPMTEERVVATFELLYLTGWAPSADQPKPLRPGSATTRLADFLKTDELGEDARPVSNVDEGES